MSDFLPSRLALFVYKISKGVWGGGGGWFLILKWNFKSNVGKLKFALVSTNCLNYYIVQCTIVVSVDMSGIQLHMLFLAGIPKCPH